MSLNWKEINVILDELALEGAQIQGVAQSAFDVVVLRVHKKGKTKNILISLSSGACRIHEFFSAFPKSEKPLRFAQFLNSRIVNGRITEVAQIGDNRIARFVVKRGEFVYNLYIRLWTNAANFIVTDTGGNVLDAMRRLPKRGEITGGVFSPENIEAKGQSSREYEIRKLPGDGSFNQKIEKFYAEQGSPLSLEALREQARRVCEGSMGRISAALERLREKEESFAGAERFKKSGDFILSNIASIKPGDKWLEADDEGKKIRIELEPRTAPAVMAQKYFEQYRKAKSGISEIQREISEGERELKEVTEKLDRLLNETNPLVLAKLLKSAGSTAQTVRGVLSKKEKTRPGLSFRRGDWLILVGRDASENDELLRRHVKGNDLWLHARDYHGSYVFIRHRSGKTVPLDILLDAGNLALFYSKGRNNAEGDLFYTQVKYLRRAKDGPKGLVIPTQEKNLHIKLDNARLRSLERSKS
ncbi:MAG: NFACT RNA binding domain-containing protein [Treponema sp.]|jgi:predicted ribosome quality control (RQC) complex YloA/Tae2 family protein|nr:NFACT RNA binding domain-containing protein [Treponema sp.]